MCCALLIGRILLGPYALTHPADTVAFVTTLLSLMRRAADRGRRSHGVSRGPTRPVALVVVGSEPGRRISSPRSDGPGHRCLPDRLHRRVIDERRDSGGRSARQQRWRSQTEDTRFSGDLVATTGTVLGVVRHEQGRLPARLRYRCPRASMFRCRPARPRWSAVKPSTAGSLEFYCSVPGHRDAGMVGAIVVQ